MTPRAYYNEIDAFCCDVLRARIADGSLPPGDVDERDIRTVDPNELRDYGQVHLFAGIGGGGLACRLAGVPDAFPIITAGVPCQDASVAGKQLGAKGERWLWPEALACLRALRSHVALLENPTGLLALHDGHEFGEILGELAAQRRDVEWDCVPACAVGAPHQRDRVWIIAYPDRDGVRHEPEREGSSAAEQRHAVALHYGAHWPLADANRGRREEFRIAQSGGIEGASGRQPHGCGEVRQLEHAAILDAAGERSLPGRRDELASPGSARWGLDQWATEPDVGRVAHGVPARMDRLRALGNAWVPQAAVPALRVILSRFSSAPLQAPLQETA